MDGIETHPIMITLNAATIESTAKLIEIQLTHTHTEFTILPHALRNYFD